MKEGFQVVGMRQADPPPHAGPQSRWRGRPVVSAVILMLIVTGCLACELIMTKDPSYLDLHNDSVPPNGEFYFGTDTMGRDIFSMIWYGGGLSLGIGFLSTFLATTIAVILGAVSGCAPKRVDAVIMRAVDILLSVPGLLVVVLPQAVLGKATVLSLSFVIGMTGWMSMSKVIRTEVRQIRNSEYVLAARCMGGGFLCIMASSCTKLYILCHVYGSDEHPQCHCGRIHVELYGDRTAGGSDLLGQYAVSGTAGSFRAGLVGHIDAGTFSGDDTCMPYKPGESSEKASEHKAQQLVENIGI